MKKLIISLAAILALSSCGIYSKYKPVTEIPDGLYGHGGTDIPGLTSADPEIQRSDTAATSATSAGGRFSPTRICAY